jgi:propanol-preferring alcohol dehydrogenase
MQAMVLEKPGNPLILKELPIPKTEPGRILIKVGACGVCRTDLHIFDGDLDRPNLPLILGHEIVGEVVELGAEVRGFALGQKVGVPWLGGTCGRCAYCSSGRENLCDNAEFTGYQIHGGYAEYTTADARFCFSIADYYTPAAAAPLLCAGLIGYRALRMTGDAENLGLYGFGAAAHIITQVAGFEGRKIYGFTRPGDSKGQEFARSLGAVWAGDSTIPPPEMLDAAIIFAPAGHLIPAALRAVKKGGIVVCAGIHMTDVPSFSYDLLWGEKTVKSVANLTRRDGEDFMMLAPRVPIRTTVETFALHEANEALKRLREGKIKGAAVLVINE